MLFKNRLQLYFKSLKLLHIWQQKVTLLSEVHLIFQMTKSEEEYCRT